MNIYVIINAMHTNILVYICIYTSIHIYICIYISKYLNVFTSLYLVKKNVYVYIHNIVYIYISESRRSKCIYI